MKSSNSPSDGLSGSLLVAHPNLNDPNFRRTILYLAHHDQESGAVGYVLNRPMASAISLPGPGIEAELHFGGPVQPECLTLASLQWRHPQGIVAFHAFESAEDGIPTEWRDGLRAFAGYSGWSAGQLENEIQQKAWFVIPPTRELIQMKDPESAWTNLMRRMGPLLALLAAAPEDPSRN
jgi:putative transcriptional regulator